MRINQLTVKNFKGFVEKSFEFPVTGPEGSNGSFHLLIGQNGTGKTSALDALAVAVGAWLSELPGRHGRPISTKDVRMAVEEYEDTQRIDKHYPALVAFEAIINGEVVTDEVGGFAIDNSLPANGGGVLEVARQMISNIGKNSDLPLIAYYGTGRLWAPSSGNAMKRFARAINAGDISKDEIQSMVGHGDSQKELSLNHTLMEVRNIASEDLATQFASRFAGYFDCLSPECNPKELLDWLKFEQQLAVQEGKESTQFVVVKEAIGQAIEGCSRVQYHLRLGLLLDIAGQPRLPFEALSDGQRNMMAMIGDIAYRAAQLNPHLGKDVLQKTRGVVLIDELDLHLHPRWQRRVMEDLRRIFPEIQFIATTHSPFIVQTARDGEIIKLDGDVLVEPEGKSLEEVARLIMDVTNTDQSPRYQQKLENARQYLALLEEARHADAQQRTQIARQLDTLIAPFADDAAYTAVLERKAIVAGF